ncbi:MAG: hypothetical protein K9K67_06840 [Bacteriovoracaceae bacterium]|nr:hypothetical protein [Bacteriovoracaceae bacterium]
MKLSSLMKLGLLVFLLANCSQKTVRLFRLPAAADTEGCLSLMRNLLKDTRPERQLAKRITSVRKSLMKNGEIEELQTLVDDLTADAANYDDESIKESAISFHSIYTNYSEAIARGEKDFTPFNEEFQKAADNFLRVRRQLRPVVSAYKNQEHYEMLRFIENIPQTKINSIPAQNRLNEFLQYMTYKKFVYDVSDVDKQEMKSFVYWVVNNPRILESSTSSFEEMYRLEFSSFQDAYKKLSKAKKNDLERVAKEALLDKYNDLAVKEIKASTDLLEVKKDTLLLLKLFSDFNEEFEEERFLSWLFKNEHLNESKFQALKELTLKEDFELRLGDALRQSYREFASFQDAPPFSDKNLVVRAKDKVKGLWNKLKNEAPSCDSLDCVSQKSLSGWSQLFKSKFYKDSFSCLAHNPLVLKTMTMDMALVWGALFWHYKSRSEEFQRFPYEVVVGGAVFAPIMAEANCRASFKSSLPFGVTLPKEQVVAGIGKKVARGLKAWRGVALRGFVASVGTLGLTMGFDHLFLAMGHTIAKPLALNDLIILMPLTFLYHGVWTGVKNVAFINPIRYKILPKLAEYVTKRKGKKMGYWALQTGLDFGAFYALMNYNQWEYLVIYQEKILPALLATFTAGVTLDHKRELSVDGEPIDRFEGVSESGISSHMSVSENDEGIKLEDGDVDVPKSEIESWAEQILKGIEN